MADTGSEVAEGTTRSTTGIMIRMLERYFLWEHHKAHHYKADDDIAIEVRCPKDDFDRRANEVIQAIERSGAKSTFRIDDERSTLVVNIPHADIDRVQRALERLHADRRSGFSLADVTGLALIEEATGRRTLGRAREKLNERVTIADASPVESSTITFANHPEDPKVDERHAEAYAKRMRDLGFDATNRTIDDAHVDASQPSTRTRRQVVVVSYLERDRDDFVTASAVALHAIGALADFRADDPYEHDETLLQRDIDRLEAKADNRRAEFERNNNLATQPNARDAQQASSQKRDQEPAQPTPTKDETPDRATEDAPAQGQGDAKLTAEQYRSMPARERAKIDLKDIPEDAFGSQSFHEAAREQSAAAAALSADREPVKAHPSIGERG